MSILINLQDRILNVNQESFLDLVFEVFDYQSKYNKVYSEYLKLLNKQGLKPNCINQIPFLPAETFKHRIIKTGDWNEDIIFESSGTTQLLKSKHHIRSLEWYHKITRLCFENHYGSIGNYEFVAFLPSINEKPNSSLVSMFHYFSSTANLFRHESTFLNDYKGLCDFLLFNSSQNKKIILFGLSFALIDFVKSNKINLTDIIIIETGGMKNSKQELDKETVLGELRTGFPNAAIHSEYGMTELMSQAYALDGLHYSSAPLLQFQISDPTDPTLFLSPGNRGLINIIDLGNIHTCSFLQTGDLGIIDEQNSLQVLGRYNPEEARGCVQMLE